MRARNGFAGEATPVPGTPFAIREPPTIPIRRDRNSKYARAIKFNLESRGSTSSLITYNSPSISSGEGPGSARQSAPAGDAGRG